MEESRGGRLRRNLEALQADLAAVAATREQVEGVAAAAQQFVAEQHRRMAEADATRRGEAERRAAVAGMRARIEEEGVANEARRAALAEAHARVAKLRVSEGPPVGMQCLPPAVRWMPPALAAAGRCQQPSASPTPTLGALPPSVQPQEEHGLLHREREALRARTDALQMTLMQSQGRDSALAADSSPAAILKKVGVALRGRGTAVGRGRSLRRSGWTTPNSDAATTCSSAASAGPACWESS